MKKKQITFQQAYIRLKEINELIRSDAVMDVDEILELQKESKDLYDFCQKKLESTTNN